MRSQTNTMDKLNAQVMFEFFSHDIPVVVKALDNANIEFREEKIYRNGMRESVDPSEFWQSSMIFVNDENHATATAILTELVDNGVIS